MIYIVLPCQSCKSSCSGVSFLKTCLNRYPPTPTAFAWPPAKKLNLPISWHCHRMPHHCHRMQPNLVISMIATKSSREILRYCANKYGSGPPGWRVALSHAIRKPLPGVQTWQDMQLRQDLVSERTDRLSTLRIVERECFFFSWCFAGYNETQGQETSQSAGHPAVVIYDGVT